MQKQTVRRKHAVFGFSPGADQEKNVLRQPSALANGRRRVKDRVIFLCGPLPTTKVKKGA